jgi:hypothetical protein
MSVTARIEAILESPDTSIWLKDALTAALARDCLDALSDAEVLFNILELHAEAVLVAAQATLNLRPELDCYSADVALCSQGILPIKTVNIDGANGVMTFEKAPPAGGAFPVCSTAADAAQMLCQVQKNG